ncbi:hypothetical protein OUY22_36385, partial [Nonomuraea sp. MCN248]
ALPDADVRPRVAKGVLAVLALSLAALLELPRQVMPPAVSSPAPSSAPSAPSTPPSSVASMPAMERTRAEERTQAAGQTVRQAVDGFHATLEGSDVCGALGGDVALDLKQVLRGALVSPGPEETRLSGLRQKLADREREGRLAPACRSQLEIRLNEISAARRSP